MSRPAGFRLRDLANEIADLEAVAYQEASRERIKSRQRAARLAKAIEAVVNESTELRRELARARMRNELLERQLARAQEQIKGMGS